MSNLKKSQIRQLCSTTAGAVIAYSSNRDGIAMTNRFPNAIVHVDIGQLESSLKYHFTNHIFNK